MGLRAGTDAQTMLKLLGNSAMRERGEPHLAALCDALNSRSVMFPGTRLRVRYAVAGCPPEAAAGPSPEAKPDIS